MRNASIALVVPALALAALLAPVHVAAPAAAGDCSPAPQIVMIQCGNVPWGGAVVLTNPAPGFGVIVQSTPNLACSPPVVTATTATTTCGPAIPGPSLCADVHAFAAADHMTSTLQAEADCGAAPASCSTNPFPANFCFSAPTVGNLGAFPLTCTARIDPPATTTGFTWWAQCSQPV